MAATHPVFASPAVNRIKTADVKGILVTNTIPVGDSVLESLPQVKVLSVAGLLGEAIRRIHLDMSISALFQGT
jgi:ribose-phosphate pyrophosphokinase